MEESYEIIPGESIGPFRLGMTREEVEQLNVRPIEIFKDNSGVEFTNVSGTFSIKTVVLLTPEEVDEAVRKRIDFRPPGH